VKKQYLINKKRFRPEISRQTGLTPCFPAESSRPLCGHRSAPKKDLDSGAEKQYIYRRG